VAAVETCRYGDSLMLILAGIDEAGYGPLLGPMTVGLSVWRVDEWTEGEAAPNLWTLLKSGVCRNPADKKSRLAIDDSKKLKLANKWEAGADDAGADSGAAHAPASGPYDPHASLVHLARGVLAVLAALEHRPTCDDGVLDALGARRPGHDCYGAAIGSCADAATTAAVGIAANLLKRACTSAGAWPVALSCRVFDESEFNGLVAEHGSKGAVTSAAFLEHARGVWERWGAEDGAGEGGPRVVCDRHGGRTDYAQIAAMIAPGVVVETLEHSPARSRYLVRAAAGDAPDRRARRMTLVFTPEADGTYLPVALASMTAKLVRELLMARFNRAFCAAARARSVELRPTAGYRNDAHRWLADAAKIGVLTPDLRRELVRRA
jgi:hypothetical protein